MSAAGASERPTLRELFGASLVALALIGIAAQTVPFERLEVSARDALLTATAPTVAYDDLLVIDFDEASLQALASQLGAWPFDRDLFAALHRHLRAAGVERVVYDVIMSDPRPGDAAFAGELAQGPPALLAIHATDVGIARIAPELRARSHAPRTDAPTTRGLLAPVPELAAAAEVAVITVWPDPDGVLRRVPREVTADGLGFRSMAVAALPGGATPGAAGDHPPAATVELRWPRNQSDLAVVPFFRVALAMAGDDAEGLPPGMLRGRTVFVGSSAAVLGDHVIMPGRGRTPGLEALAHARAALAADAIAVPMAPAVRALLAVGYLGAFLLALRFAIAATPGLSALVAVGGALLLTALAWGAAARGIVWVPLAEALVPFAALPPLALTRLWRMRIEARAAAAAVEHKGRFLAHMSHELRTPLTALIGYNKLLLTQPELSARSREMAEVAARNSDRLLGLINDLLDQAKLDAGAMRLDRKPVDPRTVVEEVRELLAPLAAGKGLALRVEVDAAVPGAVPLDALRIRQVLTNLAGNSIKFTATGSVTLALAVRAGRLAFAVRDTGEGIPADRVARIFDAYDQGSAETTGRHGGTGLGLTISAGLVELMGGRIEVDSAEGKGSTFRFELPLSGP